MRAEGGPVKPQPYILGNGDRELTVVGRQDIMVACVFCGEPWESHDQQACTAKMAAWRPVGLFAAGN